jgi:hypothetical protein
MILNKTGQDKRRQDKTGQDKTGQDKTNPSSIASVSVSQAGKKGNIISSLALGLGLRLGLR